MSICLRQSKADPSTFVYWSPPWSTPLCFLSPPSWVSSVCLFLSFTFLSLSYVYMFPSFSKALPERILLPRTRVTRGSLYDQPTAEPRCHPKGSVLNLLFYLLLLSDLQSHSARIVVYLTKPDRTKVALICGGGSGHEPSHSGFVGERYQSLEFI